MAIAKKLTASALASSLLLAIAGPAFAADQNTVDAVAQKMFDLGIIKGDGTGLNLNGTLTRAELVTTLVRSFGQEQAAIYAAGAPSFGDVHANDWYSGWVAVAKNIAASKGIAIGRDASTFDPNGQLSKVEALVFIMKFMGINVPTTAGNNWYESWVNEAVNQGILTSEQGADLLATANTKATRGEAFIILDRGYSFKGANGQSLYTTYADKELPTLNLTVPQTTSEAKLVLSGSAADNKGIASVTVNGEAVAVTNGSFSKEIALKVGKNAVAVAVTDLAGNVVTKNYEVVRGNVDADAIQASDITVTAGQTAEVAAKLVDKNGEAIDGAVIEGTSTLGAFANGVFTAGTTAGEGTLTLKSGDITKVVNVKVVAGELAKVGTDKATVNVGGVVTLTGQDQYGNAISGVTFASTADNGFVSANKFTATAAGTYDITATQNGKTASIKVSVYDAAVAGYTLTTSANSIVANNASSFTATIQAVDKNGVAIADAGVTSVMTWDANTIANFEVYNATTDSWGPLSTTTLVAGKATVTLRTTGTLGGVTQTVRATNGGFEAKANIDLVDQVATKVGVSTADKFLPNNLGSETSDFTVNVLDQDGQVMKSGVYNVNLTVAGAGATLLDNGSYVASKTVTVFGGSATATVRSAYLQSGLITVTASAEGLGTASASVTAATAMQAAKLQVVADKTTAVAANTDTVTYTVTATDANGVPVTSTATVDATFDMGDDYAQLTVNGTPLTSSKTASINLVNGKGTFTVKANKKVGGVKATFADHAGVLTGASQTVTFKAAPAANIKLDRNTTINVAVGAPETTVTAQLYDAAGNVAAEAGHKLNIASANTGVKINGIDNNETLTTDSNGQVTFKVTMPSYVNESASIAVTDADADGTVMGVATAGDNDVTVTVVNTVASSLSYTLTKNGAPVSIATAGVDYDLAVTAKDAAGRVITGETLTVTITEGATVNTVTLTDDNNDGIYTGVVTPKTAGRVALSVSTSVAAQAVTVPVAINVRAGAFAGVRVERADYTSTALQTTTGVAKAFRIVPVDQFGNFAPKTDAGNVTVTWSTGNLQAGEYFEVRSSETGASLSQITLAPGSTGTTFFILSNAASATWTLTGAGVLDTTAFTVTAK